MQKAAEMGFPIRRPLFSSSSAYRKIFPL